MATATQTITETTTAAMPMKPNKPETGAIQVVTLGLLVFLIWLLPDDALSTLSPKTKLGSVALEVIDPPRLFLSYLVLFFSWKVLGIVIQGISWASANGGITFFAFDPFSSVSTRHEDVFTALDNLRDALRVNGRPIADALMMIFGVLSLTFGYIIQLAAVSILVCYGAYSSFQYLYVNVGLTDLFSWPMPALSWVFLALVTLIVLRLIILICLIWPRPSHARAVELSEARRERKLKKLKAPLIELYEKSKAASDSAENPEQKIAAWDEVTAFKEKHGVYLTKNYEIRWKEE